jgi:hypothetical protein
MREDNRLERLITARWWIGHGQVSRVARSRNTDAARTALVRAPPPAAQEEWRVPAESMSLINASIEAVRPAA